VVLYNDIFHIQFWLVTVWLSVCLSLSVSVAVLVISCCLDWRINLHIHTTAWCLINNVKCCCEVNSHGTNFYNSVVWLQNDLKDCYNVEYGGGTMYVMRYVDAFVIVTWWDPCTGSDRGSAGSLESQGISIRAQTGQRVGTIQLHWYNQRNNTTMYIRCNKLRLKTTGHRQQFNVKHLILC